MVNGLSRSPAGHPRETWDLRKVSARRIKFGDSRYLVSTVSHPNPLRDTKIMFPRRTLLLFFLFAAAAPAQVTISAVTDAASFGPRVAPGSLATIFGSNLAGSTAHAPGFPLPTSLNGTTVFVNGSPVPLAYVSAAQINFQVPRALAAGVAQLSVKYGSGQSNSFGFLVMSAAPGIFQDSSNNAAAQDATYHAISTKNRAIAGDTIIVYLTGQGAVKNPVADGAAAPASPLATATATTTATVGGVDATVEFIGLSPGFAGLAQANIQIPKTLATATYPVVVTIGGIVGASAQIAVSGSATGAPPAVLKLVGQVGFLNSSTSRVATLGNYAYVCGVNRIAVLNLSSQRPLQRILANSATSSSTPTAARAP